MPWGSRCARVRTGYQLETPSRLNCYRIENDRASEAAMSRELSNLELINLAAHLVNPKRIGDYLVGDVGAALVTEEGSIYRGVCLDTSSGLGFCAERTAIAQMITSKEYKIQKIVAVWNDNPEKVVYVLPPCGACRQFMLSMSEDALNIDVVLGSSKTIKLKELLLYSEWPESTLGGEGVPSNSGLD